MDAIQECKAILIHLNRLAGGLEGWQSKNSADTEWNPTSPELRRLMIRDVLARIRKLGPDNGNSVKQQLLYTITGEGLAVEAMAEDSSRGAKAGTQKAKKRNKTAVKGKKGSAQRKSSNLLVLTIKQRELYATLAAFGLDPYSPAVKSEEGFDLWQVPIQARSRKYNVWIAMVGEVGRDSTREACDILVPKFRARLAVLLGMAAGKTGSVQKCDVVGVLESIDIEGGIQYPSYIQLRGKTVDIDSILRRQVLNFDPVRFGWQEKFLETCNVLSSRIPNVPQEYTELKPTFRTGICLSTEKKREDNPFQTSGLESFSDKIILAEMEGYGFGRACTHLGVPWVHFRGIADFAVKEGMAESKPWQYVASAAAATACRLFLENSFMDPRKG